MRYDLWIVKRAVALQARARDLAQGVIKPRARRVDQTEEYAWDNVEALRDAGFMGMTIPKAYGGGGKTFLDVVLVIEEMARCCGAAGRIAVEANMGAISAIMAYGTEEQKKFAANFRCRRQAGNLHHRAGRRQCGDGNDDAGRESAATNTSSMGASIGSRAAVFRGCISCLRARSMRQGRIWGSAGLSRCGTRRRVW